MPYASAEDPSLNLERPGCPNGCHMLGQPQGKIVGPRRNGLHLWAVFGDST